MTEKHSICLKQLLQGQTYSLLEGKYQLSLQEGLVSFSYDRKLKEYVPIKIAEPIFIKKTVQNIDTQDVYLVLTYWFRGKFIDIKIGMGELIPQELLKLTRKGVDIQHASHKSISEFLMEQSKHAPHDELYRYVGWHVTEDEEMYFRHARAYPKEVMPNAMIDDENGLYHLQPKGRLETWLEMIRNEVQGNVQLEFIVAAGFSAVLVGAFHKMYDDVDTLLIHLAGDSTQGKTTAALLAVSGLGMPSNRIGGLQKTWNGTTNATINSISGNYGIPIVFDELSMSRANSMTSDVYVLTSGQEKARLTDQITQRKQGTWSTTIFSTGEQSIFERTSQNAGLMVRAFEFTGIQWTNSAEHADTIKEVIQENYGYAGIEFINYLLREDTVNADDLWKEWQEKCVSSLEDTPFRTRIARKYAIILTAADLINASLGLEFDTEKILSFLAEQEEEKMLERDLGEKGLRFLKQFIIENQQKFKVDGYGGAPQTCFGKIKYSVPYVEVSILKNIMLNAFREAKFEDPRAVIRDLDEKELLVKEADRLTKRTFIFDKDEQNIRKKMNEQVVARREDTTYTFRLHLENDLGGMVSPFSQTHGSLIFPEDEFVEGGE